MLGEIDAGKTQGLKSQLLTPLTDLLKARGI